MSLIVLNMIVAFIVVFAIGLLSFVVGAYIVMAIIAFTEWAIKTCHGISGD